jgi:MYXO-CTERM domain-containing protein
MSWGWSVLNDIGQKASAVAKIAAPVVDLVMPGAGAALGAAAAIGDSAYMVSEQKFAQEAADKAQKEYNAALTAAAAQVASGGSQAASQPVLSSSPAVDINAALQGVLDKVSGLTSSTSPSPVYIPVSSSSSEPAKSSFNIDPKILLFGGAAVLALVLLSGRRRR